MTGIVIGKFDSIFVGQHHSPSEKRESRIHARRLSKVIFLVAFASCLSTALFLHLVPSHLLSTLFRPPLLSASTLLRSDPDPYAHLRGYCSNVNPILSSEFHARQQKLADILEEEDAVYVAEPGANAFYLGNISSTDWRLSERPLLLIISPDNKQVPSPQVTILTPKFEATRARLLSVPSNTTVSYLEWAEDENPYELAVQAFRGKLKNVFADEQTRAFILSGLQNANPNSNVQVAPPRIKALRERKSKAEIALLRCANEATLLGIRAVRKHLHFGIRSSVVKQYIQQALVTAGLQSTGGIVLFGPDAALPHGSGTDRTLSPKEFVLMDIGGTLHGYHSDITRTFALENSDIKTIDLIVWFAVQEAQRAAHMVAINGSVASGVDKAARTILDQARYGQYFTHRLGHGIGLEGHESPYLRGGSEEILAVGNTFSNEPGVYIEGEIGVRLEDVFVVGEDGLPEFLTSRVGGPASSPWDP